MSRFGKEWCDVLKPGMALCSLVDLGEATSNIPLLQVSIFSVTKQVTFTTYTLPLSQPSQYIELQRQRWGKLELVRHWATLPC